MKNEDYKLLKKWHDFSTKCDKIPAKKAHKSNLKSIKLNIAENNAM